MSGAAAASNRLMMFSAFMSLDGVTFGGGGTAGFSYTGAEAPYRVVRFLLYDQISGLCWCFRMEKQQLATLDGDLGIGGGPPGLRVWLDASLTLTKWRQATFQSKYRTCEAKSEMCYKMLKRADESKFRDMLCRSTGAVMQDK